MDKSEQIDQLDKEINAELVKLLYAGSKFRPCLHFIFGIIVVLIMSAIVPTPYIVFWVFILFTLNFFRFADIGKTQKIINEIRDIKPVQKRFALYAGLLGLTYGLGLAIIFTQLPLLNQIYLLCLVATLVLAGLVSFASDKHSFYAYFYGLCIPLFLKILLIAKFSYVNIAACCIFIAVSRKLFIWNHDALKNSIRLQLKHLESLESLQQTNIKLEQQNIIDELTGIANRRHLSKVLGKEWSRANRIGSSLALLMIDIDYFKQYNDTFGHLKGDECLKNIATTLTNNLNRSADFVARYGGEEFCILMPETDLSGAKTFAKKIHSSIIELKIDNPGSDVSKYLTISIGIAAVIPGRSDSYMDLIYTSDKALYKAKKDGRNIIRSKRYLEKSPKQN